MENMVRVGAVKGDYGCSMQTQYIAHYLEGIGGKPRLSKGLRVDTSAMGGDYHQYTIHRDDAAEFFRRLELHRDRSLNGRQPRIGDMVSVGKIDNRPDLLGSVGEIVGFDEEHGTFIAQMVSGPESGSNFPLYEWEFNLA